MGTNGRFSCKTYSAHKFVSLFGLRPCRFRAVEIAICWRCWVSQPPFCVGTSAAMLSSSNAPVYYVCGNVFVCRLNVSDRADPPPCTRSVPAPYHTRDLGRGVFFTKTAGFACCLDSPRLTNTSTAEKTRGRRGNHSWSALFHVSVMPAGTTRRARASRRAYEGSASTHRSLSAMPQLDAFLE